MSLNNERRSRARGESRRVLVVDDEADIRELLDLTLARMGCRPIAPVRWPKRGASLPASATSCA
jgi:CheY-like chemotaxis protein